MIKELLEYSIKQNLAHIPSALSHYPYLYYLYEYNFIKPYEHNIVIGKPFGAQAYYLIWKKLGYLKDIENLSYGVKHSEIDFVNFSEETLGNALGVASGIELANKKPTWVHLSDAALEIGSTLEAVQFIGENQQNVKITIDFNQYGLTRKLPKKLVMYLEYFALNGWIDEIVNIDNLKFRIVDKKPQVFFIKTIKGYGVKEMEQNPIEWHYKKLKDLNEITINR